MSNENIQSILTDLIEKNQDVEDKITEVLRDYASNDDEGKGPH